MGEPTDVEISPKRIKKTRWGPKSESELVETEAKKNKPIEEQKKVIPNGTGSGTPENLPGGSSTKEKPKEIKITKISKANKTEKQKVSVKSTIEEEPHIVEPDTCHSQASSKSSDDSFHGFDNVELNKRYFRKQASLQKIIENLGEAGNTSSIGSISVDEQDVGVKESDTTEDGEGKEDEEMTVDTDSNQMEIEICNDKDTTSSKADSTELSDIGTNRLGGDSRTIDSDVEIIEQDSVKSGDKSHSKSQKVEDSKTDNNKTNSPILESHLKSGAKIEYCGGCEAEVDDAEEGICCDGECERWFHLRCSGLSQAEYDALSLDENAKWTCSKCSGKAPSLGKKFNKPLLTVRKDLGAFSTPSPKRRSLVKEGRTPKIDIANPAFLKPFDFGWKRELVYRSTNDNQNRRQGDIYYYTPKGKKLRSLREISDHLIGSDLTPDNFTFWKEPLGIDDPDKEIIRDAKFKMVNKDSVTSPVVPKKVIPKITKLPKPAPKLTATVNPLDSSNGSLPVTPKASASVTPRVVFKGKPSVGSGPKFKVTPSKTSTPGQPQKIVITKGNKKEALKQKAAAVTNIQERNKKKKQEANVRSAAFIENEIESEDDIEIDRRNNFNFRRYGLLANAKSSWKKPTQNNSFTSSSEDLSNFNPETLDVGTGTQYPHSLGLGSSEQSRSRRTNCATSHCSKVVNFNGNEELTFHHNRKKTLVYPFPKTDSNTIILPPSNPEELHSENSVKRPPEIQFRPSNPSSYGCQTSPIMPLRLVGPSTSSQYNSNLITCNNPFETVLIVDTCNTDNYETSPPKSKDVSYETPLVVKNNDCSLKIIGVRSLTAKESGKFNHSLLVPSSANQCTSTRLNKESSATRISDNRLIQSCFKKGSNLSPVSVESSSSEEIVVVDDDMEDSSSPLFLLRNSPPPKTKNISSPNRSLQSLRPIPSPPPLVAFRKRTESLSQPSCSFSNQNCTTSSAPDEQLDTLRDTEKKKKSPSDDDMELGMLPPMWESLPKSKDKLRAEVCSIECIKAMGLIPTLQCHVCLCLYHPECVGLEEAKDRTIHSYKCKNCQEKPKQPSPNSSKLILPPPPLTPISTLSTIGTSQPPMAPPKLQRMSDGKSVASPRGRFPLTKTSSILGGVTTWLPPSSSIQLRPSPHTSTKMSPYQRPLPPTTTTVVDSAATQPVQTLVSMDCKRYIVVPKHNVLSVSPATTSSAQVADPVTTHITTSASDPSTTVSAIPSQAYGPGGPILPKPQVSTSTAFIVSSPTTSTSNFQNPPGVLLVPYIAPQSSPIQKDGQQPQYIVVNGPSGLQPGNFIIGNIPQQQQLKLPTVPTSQPAEPPPESAGVKRPLEDSEESPMAKRAKIEGETSQYMQHFAQHISIGYKALLHAFQYLKVQELLRASRVCHLWRDMALHKSLWETVRMKNSQVKDWEGFAATLRSVGTRHLDLRKILMPDKPEALKAMWSDCIKALSKVNTLVKLDLCRCTSFLMEQIAAVCPQLEYISAGAIKSPQIHLTNLRNCQNLTELKLKGQGGLEVIDVSVLENLTKLKHLSLTVVKNTTEVLEVVGKMTQLECLELGDFMSVTESNVTQAFSQLHRLRRLRLEKGQQECPTEAILRTISQLPSLVQLELINFDVKAGFEDSLALCSNIKILLIIPTYVTQSATTNHLVIEGVSKLSKTLNHFVWGLTLELLRVTDLFIDQWEMGQKNAAGKSPNQTPQKKSSSGDSIPILKPSSTSADGKTKEGAVTQVDVLQLPKLHKVLSTLLPNTKIIILKVPFNATWRQTISGSNP